MDRSPGKPVFEFESVPFGVDTVESVAASGGGASIYGLAQRLDGGTELAMTGDTSLDMSLRCFDVSEWEDRMIEVVSAQVTLPFRWPTLASCEAPCEGSVHRDACFAGGVTTYTKTQLRRAPDPRLAASAEAYQGVTYTVDDQELFSSLAHAESLPIPGRYWHTANDDLSEDSSINHPGSSTARMSTYGLVRAKAAGDPSRETCAMAEIRSVYEMEATAEATCAVRTQAMARTQNTDHSARYHSNAFQLKSGLLVRNWCP